jgi:hypothetical protein
MKINKWCASAAMLLVCAAPARAQSEPADIDTLHQRMLDACPARWEDVVSDIDPSTVSGDLWNGNTSDKETFKTFLSTQMGANAPSAGELETMASDPPTVAGECATQRLGFLDGLMQKMPKDVLTAMSAVTKQLDTGAGTYGLVPPGAVMAFNLASCPEGWSRFVAGGGLALLYCQREGPDTAQATPTPGLAWSCYSDKTLTTLYASGIDPQVDLSSSHGSWGTPRAGTQDNFSCRWEGFIKLPQSETVTFYTRSDDGVRLYVDNTLVIDNWTGHSVTEDSGTYPVLANQYVAVRLEYFQGGGEATIKLQYRSPTISKSLIAAEHLFH